MREWVVVSPHRTSRPWLGKTEQVPTQPAVEYDPTCYLCPGNSRAGGAKNPQYTDTFVFDNDYSALLRDTPLKTINQKGLIVAQGEPGICRVVCFTPRHDLSIPSMSVEQIEKVVGVWTDQYRELGALPWVNHVQVFENRGAMMGASNPHPHCQVWGNATVPDFPSQELASQQDYRSRAGGCMLCDYLDLERNSATRVVCENGDFVVVVPFWAVWPFETLLLSKRHLGSMDELSESERRSLTEILQRVTRTYDRVFDVPFPYSMGFHQRPTDNRPHEEWHFHAHYYPPLLRSATVQKFMVGYEMLCSPQRDITPETAAERLRALVE